jgi:tetraacyldisaccharide 4'-kinase
MLSLALTPLSWIYAAGWQVYLATYRSGIRRQTMPPIPTLCVGNLEVGGSGKTPVAIAVVKLLIEMGYRPALSLSGYGSPASRGATVLPTYQPVRAEEHGDETALARLKLPETPLIVGRKRTLAAALAPGLGADVLVLDDGFQHLPLARDLDLIVWQPERTHQRCLPAGPLREPERNVRRASALLLPSASRLPNYELPSFLFDRKLGPLRNASTGEEVSLSEAPKKVIAFSAIARPERFRTALESLGFTVVGERAFPDHHALASFSFSPHETYICTEKDLVKLQGRTDTSRVFALVSDVEFPQPEPLIEFLRRRLEMRKT